MRRPLPRTLRSCLLLILMFAANPARPAHAVEERGWVSLELSGAFYDPEQALRDGYGYGAHGGFFLNRWAGVEALVHRSAPDLETPELGSASFLHYGGGIFLTPDRTRWTLPYVYGGIGMAKLER